MQRRMFGAAALVTGLVAGLGMAIGVRRRRSHRDELLPIDPAPPLSGAVAASVPGRPTTSVGATAGAGETTADAAPAKPRRRRQHRKPAAAVSPSGEGGEPVAATKPRRRRPPSSPAATTETDPGDVAADAS